MLTSWSYSKWLALIILLCIALSSHFIEIMRVNGNILNFLSTSLALASLLPAFHLRKGIALPAFYLSLTLLPFLWLLSASPPQGPCSIKQPMSLCILNPYLSLAPSPQLIIQRLRSPPPHPDPTIHTHFIVNKQHPP